MTTPASAPRRTRELAAYASVAIAWLSTRLLAGVSVDMTPWMLNDLDIYLGWAPDLAAGSFPALDPTWQYPPGIAPLFVSAWVLPLDFRWGFTLVILAVDAVLMASLLLAHARTPGSSWRGPWLWALAGLIVGPIMMVRFDVVPTMFAAVAVLLAARPAASGAIAALGALTKVWPALMLLALPRRQLPRALLSFAIVAAVALVGVLLLTDNGLSFLENQQSRGLQVESVGALPYGLWSIAGGTVAFGLEYGSIQVLMSGAETVGLVVSVIGLALLGLLAWARLSGRLESVPPGDVALTVILASVATSRVYSPQFNVWLVGLAAVAILNRNSRLTTVAALVVVVSLLTQVVYPWSATQLVTGDVITVLVQAARIILLVWATVLAFVRILGRTPAEEAS